MTEITREELELCAELLGIQVEGLHFLGGFIARRPYEGFARQFNPTDDADDREALAKAAKLIVNYRDNEVGTPDGEYLFLWPMHGTYEQCIVKAASAAARARNRA